MHAAELLVACLEREGVDHVFGLPGEEMADLLFAIRDSDITFVPVRHEQGAAFMADVHGRLTGEAGVCLATLGPGATNLLTGVADAHLDKSPLVAITAQGGLERLHVESHQALDVAGLFDPVTEWNTQLDDPDIVHESVHKAFKLAESEKPGATHLELPEDIAAETTEKRPLPERDPVRAGTPSPDTLETVTSLLADADRPLVIAGNGAVRTRAATQLRAFVAAFDLPAASTFMGKGAVSDDDERSLYTLDSGDGAALSAIETADLVVTVGYDIAEHDPAKWHCEDTPIVHVDSEPAEVYEAYHPDVEVVGDIGDALGALTARAEETATTTDDEWYAEMRDAVRADVDATTAAEAPFTVKGVLPVLRDVLAPEDVLVSDVGSHKMAIAQNYPTYEPNTCIVSNGLASMGIAVPGGVAADLAVDAEVVAATGDGGFLMNAAELETATRLDCSYTVVVFTDDDYGLISAKQRAATGDSFGTRLTNPAFGTFAESFGIDSYRPTTRAELRDDLAAAVDGGMSLVEIAVG